MTSIEWTDDDSDGYGPDSWDDDNGELQPGECDTCSGRDVVVDGPLGPIHCACAIGQGASVEDCRCGLSEGGAL